MIFNLQKHSDHHHGDLLKLELESFDIIQQDTGRYVLVIGDETVTASSLKECREYISQGIQELKSNLWDSWHDLSHLSQVITQNDAGNEPSLNNILFLTTVKRAFFLSQIFSDLSEISKSIKELFNIDASEIHKDLISKFNLKYLEVKLLHHLLMTEIYRVNLITKYMHVHKKAQISGPWANLDLPMKERVWEFAEDEEYFENRSRAKREQVRYNPEMLPTTGFYYIWQDLSRNPYLFDDRDTQSPYKSRKIMQIP